MNETQHLTEIDIDNLTEDESRELLDYLRGEIDNIDEEIVGLLNERALKSALIGKLKSTLGLPNYSPKREKEIIKRIFKIANYKLGSPAVIRIFERIIDEFRAIQKRERQD